MSEFSKGDIVEQFRAPSGVIDVVYNAGFHLCARNNHRSSCRRTIHNERPTFFCGQPASRKNLKGLEAFRLYRTRGGEHELLIVGDDANETQADGVHYAGRLGRELAEVMRGAEGLVFVPWFEGFGVPIVEAFASGVPVIASNTTAMPEVCGDAAAVDPANAQEIAEAMKLLETDRPAESGRGSWLDARGSF